MTVNNVSRALRDSLDAVRAVIAAYGLGDAERGFFWIQWAAICEGNAGNPSETGGGNPLVPGVTADMAVRAVSEKVAEYERTD